MNKTDLIQLLGLTAHIEGGYFRETYRSVEQLSVPGREEKRSFLTSIYYLLTNDRPLDQLHRNRSAIMHYFHGGSAVTYWLISPENELQKVRLGNNLLAGETPQLLVPGGYWKTALLETGEYGLLGEAVAPGFDYQDMEVAPPESIESQFPGLWQILAPHYASVPPAPGRASGKISMASPKE